jgi:hypothetical protein
VEIGFEGPKNFFNRSSASPAAESNFGTNSFPISLRNIRSTNRHASQRTPISRRTIIWVCAPLTRCSIGLSGVPLVDQFPKYVDLVCGVAEQQKLSALGRRGFQQKRLDAVHRKDVDHSRFVPVASKSPANAHRDGGDTG